eukprot:1108068-Pelagomonas_calceolata.AAC.6
MKGQFCRCAGQSWVQKAAGTEQQPVILHNNTCPECGRPRAWSDSLCQLLIPIWNGKCMSSTKKVKPVLYTGQACTVHRIRHQYGHDVLPCCGPPAAHTNCPAPSSATHQIMHGSLYPPPHGALSFELTRHHFLFCLSSFPAPH